MSNSNGPKRKKPQVSAKQKRKQVWAIMITTIVVLVLILAIVAIVFQNKKAAPEHQPSANSPAKDSAIEYKGEPMMGRKEAPVRIAEFGDYRCMYCRQFELSIFPKLQKDYIDTGKVQFYFMNYTILGTGSVLAADAAEFIYDKYPDHFWDFHKLIYENQGPEEVEWVTKDVLIDLAKKAVPKLNVKQLQAALDQGSYIDAIRKDAEMGKAAGVQGTPSIFINGKPVPNEDTLNYDKLKTSIDEALKKE